MADERKAGGSIWANRTRRLASRLNVGTALLLAALVLGMLNYVAYRYLDVRWDVSSRGYYRLSDKTRSLLRSINGTVHVAALFQRGSPHFDDVRNLLREYEYEAAAAKSVKLDIEFVDPDRDLARARELARKYDVSEPNVVIFDLDGRRKYVAAADLVDYEVTLEKDRAYKRMTGFKGEQAFSSAIQSVVEATTPTVCFLMGHGEHDIDDSSQQSGYSKLARALRRDNIDVLQILLAQYRGVPTNCSALIVAGPTRSFSQAEVDMLSEYLNKNGRVLFMLDAATATGLDKLLETWGVRVGSDVVVGLTLTGRELVVANYGNHPVTRLLHKVTTMFYTPRSVEPAWSEDSAARGDKPRVSVLALSTKAGWAEADLAQNPPRFDPETDRRGPIAIAVACEKGLRSDIRVEVKPTRLVVVGDSAFVSNGALASGIGGNIDFFLSAVNWLIEREALMAIAPRTPGELHLDMNRQQLTVAALVMVAAAPALAVIVGFLVWLRRRQ